MNARMQARMGMRRAARGQSEGRIAAGAQGGLHCMRISLWACRLPRRAAVDSTNQRYRTFTFVAGPLANQKFIGITIQV